MVVPPVRRFTSPDDELIEAICGSLLEKDNTPVGLFDVIVINDEIKKSSSRVFLVNEVWDKDRVVAICFGTKFETLVVDNTLPVGKVPGAYVATIEGVKIVPTGSLLNAVRISAFVIGTLLLFPDTEDGIS